MSVASEVPVLPDSPTTAASPESSSDSGPRYAPTSVQLRTGSGRHEGLSWVGFTDPFTKPESTVVASVYELLNGVPVRGRAAIRVANVIAGSGRIDVVVDVGWDSPLSYVIKFVIYN